jgi:hypothetical protein
MFHVTLPTAMHLDKQKIAVGVSKKSININYVDHLIDATRTNKAVYADFDRTFYK